MGMAVCESVHVTQSRVANIYFVSLQSLIHVNTRTHTFNHTLTHSHKLQTHTKSHAVTRKQEINFVKFFVYIYIYMYMEIRKFKYKYI